MDVIVEAIGRVRAALRLFAGAPRERLLHVRLDAETRIAILQHVAACELDPARRRPFLFIEAPTEEDDDGWELRAEEVTEEMAEATERLLAQAPELRLGPAQSRTGKATGGLARFAVELRAALDGLPPEVDGLVVVLAPLLVAEASSWVGGLRLLLDRPELSAVKWIVVETGAAPGLKVAAALGAAAVSIDARIAPDATRAALTAMLAGMASAPAGAEGFRLAGMAGPDESPPRRGRPAATPASAGPLAGDANAPPDLAGASVLQQVRVDVLGAALAAQEGRPVDAVRLQSAARDRCAAAGLARETVLMELVLGSYALHGGARAAAIATFDQAHARASAAELPELRAQALMAKGSALLLEERHVDAALAYIEAGNATAALASPSLAIEAFRLAGAALVAAGHETQAVTAWRRGVQIAEAKGQDELAGSSAPAVARALAEICRRYELRVQAESLERQAATWEAAAGAPTAEAPSAADSAEADG